VLTTGGRGGAILLTAPKKLVFLPFFFLVLRNSVRSFELGDYVGYSNIKFFIHDSQRQHHKPPKVIGSRAEYLFDRGWFIFIFGSLVVQKIKFVVLTCFYEFYDYEF
jgi:hypothetical protein